MKKEEKKRTFDAEVLILPALKMVLVDIDKDHDRSPGKQVTQKAARDLSEETVLKLIQKLAAKE